MSIRKEAETEKQKLKNMSWQDRAWYVWEYYKFHLLAIVLAAGALYAVGNMIYRQSFSTVLSIAVINDQSGGQASMEPLEAGLKEALGCSSKELIEINEGLSVNFGDEDMSQFAYASLAKISALAASRSLDVVIGDKGSIDHYASVNTYENLEGFLPPELYTRVRQFIYHAPDGQGQMQPVAISLEGTSFSSQTGAVMDPPYLAVAAGSPHKEAALLMIEYLFP